MTASARFSLPAGANALALTSALKRAVADRFLRNLASMGAAQLVQRLSRLVAAIVLSRWLDQESFGLAAVALTVYEFVALFTRNGITAKVVQAGEDEVKKVAQTGYWMTWAVCLGLMVIQIGVALPVARLYHDPRLALPIALMSLVYLATPVSNLQAAFIQREGRIGRFALASAVQVTTDNLLTAAFAYAGFGMWAIIWPKLIVAPIWVVFLRTGHSWRADRFPGVAAAFAGWRAIARFSLGVVGVELMTTIQANIDNLIVGYYLGLEALGVYYFAFNAGLGISLGFVNAFSTAIYPHLCQTNSDPEALARRFRKARRTVGLAIMPLILVQAFAAPLYVPLVFGAKWLPAIPVLTVICLSALARPFAAATSQLLRAVGRPHDELRWQAALTVMLVAALLVAARFNLLAVAFAVLIVQTSMLGAFSIFAPRLAFRRAGLAAKAAPTGEAKADILIVAIEAGRWGPARLPAAFSRNGLRVSALAPPQNALAHTEYLHRLYELEFSRSHAEFARSLAEAMRDARPELVIPADEQVVVMMHTLIRRAGEGKRGPLDAGMIAKLTQSLGDPDHYEDALFKHRTLALARSNGVRTPEGRIALNVQEAIEAARSLGFPVFVKASFSWAGQGVVDCENEAEVAAAVDRMSKRRFAALRALVRRWAGRDWYPVAPIFEVQRKIVGMPGSFAVAARHGAVLAGLALQKVVRETDTGPSTVAKLGDHAEMADSAIRMVRALGANGLLAFDFMIDAKTGAAYLIECNPRPVPIGHLAPRVGVDLCAALAASLRGRQAAPTLRPTHEITTPLFPQQWLMRGEDDDSARHYEDAPLEDPRLLQFMFAEGARRRSRSGILARMPAQMAA